MRVGAASATGTGNIPELMDMDYFDFIRHHLYERRVRIEGDLRGLWRCERCEEFRLGDAAETTFERDGTEPDESLLEIRSDTLAEYVKSRLCTACRPDICGIWGPRDFVAYAFDPASGLLRLGCDTYWLVERVTADELLVADLNALSQGCVTRNRYSRLPQE